MPSSSTPPVPPSRHAKYLCDMRLYHSGWMSRAKAPHATHAAIVSKKKRNDERIEATRAQVHVSPSPARVIPFHSNVDVIARALFFLVVSNKQKKRFLSNLDCANVSHCACSTAFTSHHTIPQPRPFHLT